jgi:hypothetical protein
MKFLGVRFKDLRTPAKEPDRIRIKEIPKT